MLLWVKKDESGSFWVSWGQEGSNWGQLESCGVRDDQTRISWEDLSERLWDGFYERDVIWFGKQLCE